MTEEYSVEIDGTYKRDFVEKYGELMFWRGASRYTKDTLSRALYSEQMLKIIELIKGDNILRQSYEDFIQGENDLSLNSLESRCKANVEHWRDNS